MPTFNLSRALLTCPASLACWRLRCDATRRDFDTRLRCPGRGPERIAILPEREWEVDHRPGSRTAHAVYGRSRASPVASRSGPVRPVRLMNTSGRQWARRRERVVGRGGRAVRDKGLAGRTGPGQLGLAGRNRERLSRLCPLLLLIRRFKVHGQPVARQTSILDPHLCSGMSSDWHPLPLPSSCPFVPPGSPSPALCVRQCMCTIGCHLAQCIMAHALTL